MINEEQLEAAQQEIDEDRIYRNQFLKKISQDKIDFVEKELVKFQKKGIPVYIYAYLPSVDDDAKEFESLYQYNNLSSFFEDDGEGHQTPECKLLFHRVNKGLAYHMVRLLGHMNTMPEKFEDCIEKAQQGVRHIYACFVWCISKDPHEEELRKIIKEKNE